MIHLGVSLYSYIHIPKTSGFRIRLNLLENNSFPSTQAKYWSHPKVYRNEYFIAGAQLLDPRFREENIIDRNVLPTHLSRLELARQAQIDGFFVGHITLTQGLNTGFNIFCSLFREPRARLLSEFLFTSLGKSDVINLPSNQFSNQSQLEVIDKFFVHYLKNTKSIYKQYLRPSGLAKLKRYHLEMFWDFQAGELLRTCFQVEPGQNFETTLVNSLTTQNHSKLHEVVERVLHNPLFHEAVKIDIAFMRQLMKKGILDSRNSDELENDLNKYLEVLIPAS